MPRDNDKDNDSRGRRDRPGGGQGRAGGGKGRSGAARGPEKKFAKRGFAGKSDGDKRDGERRPYAGKSDGARSFDKKPYSGGAKPYAGKRDGDRPPRRDFDAPRPPRGDRPFRDRSEGGDRPPRFNRDDRPRGDRPFSSRPSRGDDGEKRSFKPREDRGGEKRPYTPRGDRPNFNRDDRPPRRDRESGPRDRDDARPASRFGEKKFGEKRPYTPRGEGGGEKRPYTPRGDGPRGDRPERKFGGDKKFSSRGAPDRGPRKSFGADRSDSKPWQKREDRGGRDSRPARDGARGFDKPRFSRDDRGGEERPRFSRSREDRPAGDRPKFDRPRQRPEGRTDWQEHPRSDARDERPRRENEDDSKIFAKRPAFGGRGAYRERKTEFEKRGPQPPKVKKSGERIAKVVSRAGLASRRDAEEWITQGRVSVNGRVINSPALDVTVNDVITVDGKPLPPRERTRLFMFHKPRGLMTTHADPEGRPTVFDNLPEGLPRLISIGRLDFNTEGLLLLTNDGGLARALELPDTGWLRRYRVRAHGEVTQAQLDELKKGVEVDGVKYGSIDATLERDQGANVWLVFAIREGKNREVRNVMAHLGLEVNRLIRVSYGPFQLGELAEGEVEEVKTRVLREQLGEKIATLAGADFNRPMPGDKEPTPPKPVTQRGVIADRKGRRVLVQRTGSEEARARNEEEANGYGPPRRPQRGYHGKRDLKPRDE
ncbi:pseudouridine synthase [Bradyrhizobium sp. AUGA SZCCT0240]|uniref:pseudouridine synthase n=1 Tax=unclassified Bradyrhizobium TaxID=2631580 RepID=UPI001BA97635|nr:MULTISPECIES: pseudouridine synthase [unclassified Bradyrhizobium]MBR1200280.1 pseudouridine synthase [Bradyrhizobium sp. AUGA SZCCT0158]MBR1244512.1 pseudouridine synthase [Bradyrhizobium sp. AUGA SZCCT0274]MBR1256703.1 pseudouridine synthase [Bradyrhizobium sp. AUGA SZCCT0240]